LGKRCLVRVRPYLDAAGAVARGSIKGSRAACSQNKVLKGHHPLSLIAWDAVSRQSLSFHRKAGVALAATPALAQPALETNCWAPAENIRRQ